LGGDLKNKINEAIDTADTETSKTLAEWMSSSIVFGYLGDLNTIFLLSTEGDNKGSVWEVKVDTLAVMCVAKNFLEFLDVLVGTSDKLANYLIQSIEPAIPEGWS